MAPDEGKREHDYVVIPAQPGTRIRHNGSNLRSNVANCAGVNLEQNSLA